MNRSIVRRNFAEIAAAPFYSTACVAIAKAIAVDEVLEISNRAAALRTYALQAKNIDLEIDAVEIRLRATRRIGQLLETSISEGSLDLDAKSLKRMSEDTILQIAAVKCGVNHGLARKARRLARPSDHNYEVLIVDWRERCRSDVKVTLKLLPNEPKKEQFVEPDLVPTGPFEQSVGDYLIGDITLLELAGVIERLHLELAFFQEISNRVGSIEHFLLPGRAAHEQPKLRDVIRDVDLRAMLAKFGFGEGTCEEVEAGVTS